MENDITDHEAQIAMLEERIADLKVQLSEALVDRDYYKNLIDQQADAQFEQAGGDEAHDRDSALYDNINDLI